MAHLSIDVLGSLQVFTDDQPVTTLESVKVRALLAYLAVESDQPHRREKLVGLFWPDYPEADARHNLRQALFNLRSIIGDHSASPPYLIINRDAVQFNRESDYSLDLDRFNHLFFTCEEHLSQCLEDCSKHAAHLEEMVKLYRGEFLQQLLLEDSTEFEEWTLIQRENAHQHILEAHAYLTNYYLLQNDLKAARLHASRQLELDPWREEAHRQMMRVLALDGERSAALAQFETCKRVLADELDVEPSTETRDLYEQIRLGTLKPQALQPPNSVPPSVISLPVQLTPFIGREAELEYLGELITNPECRCISLVGPGGIGKTRLAIQAAEEHLSQFAHGAALIQLASVNSVGGIVTAITNAVNATFYGPDDAHTQLLSYLSERQMLLILDNAEHLLAENLQQENITQLLIQILQSASQVKLVVTSREALNIQEEWIYEVQGLGYPATEQTQGFDQFDAIALFVQRARRASPNFSLNPNNQVQGAQICRMVEGMPLAIELAATWMRTLSPAEIASEIEKNVDFLSASVRDMPERHRSIRVVFDHSWQMLSPAERVVLSKLSVFRGGFQRQAAEQVAGATLSILSTLVNRTLLRRASTGRYDLHELVRQYCADHLASNLEVKSETQEQHCNFYLALAETANLELQGRNQLEWLSRLEQEHDNLRVALEWSLNNCMDGRCYEISLRLPAALRWFWRMRGHFHEGCDWLLEALQNSPERRTQAHATALVGLSLLMNGVGDLGRARPPAEESVIIFRELDVEAGLAEALMILGLTLLWQGEATEGLEHTRQALEIFRKVGDRWGEAQALYRLGSYLSDYGGAPEGRRMLEESARILESFDEKYLYTSVLIALGIVDMNLGDYNVARLRFEGGLTASREIKHPWGLADVLTNLGCLYRIQGDFVMAQARFEEALKVYRQHGRNVWEIDAHCAMTENAIVQGDFSTARLHLQAAESLLGVSGNKILQVLLGYLRGLLLYYEGNIDAAGVGLNEIVNLAREGGFKPDLARSLLSLGLVRLKQGEVNSAAPLILESLKTCQETGHKLGYAVAFEALALVSLAQGDEKQAVELFSNADTLRREMEAPLPPVDQRAHASVISILKERLGEVTFDDLWQQGAKRPYEAVARDVLEAGIVDFEKHE